MSHAWPCMSVHVHAGACNYSGQPAFVCVPSEGVVMGEGSKEVRIFFSPDHQSKAYSDRLLVDYNGKVVMAEWCTLVYSDVCVCACVCSVVAV